MKPVRFVVVGIGGYALVHLNAIEWLHEQGMAELSGVVALKSDQEKDPELMRSLRDRGIEVYSDVDDFFNNCRSKPDVLTVPIGIHMHVPVSIRAMQAGMHVYCEKPLAATVQEVDALIEVQKQTGKKVAVGFQHIYSFSMQQLKSRICDGRLGAVRDIALMCGWPRSIQYYTRNDWAGCMRKNDHWVLDSPANNAHSHYLFNMLYLCGAETAQAATPQRVHAELYRVNHIDGPDTVQVMFGLSDDRSGHAIVTHCNTFENGPKLHMVCENGEVRWQGDIGKTVISYNNGLEESFDNLTHEQWRCEGFRDLIESINSDKAPLCTPEMARNHTLTVNAIHQSCPQIQQVPDSAVTEVQDWEIFPPDTKGDFRRVLELDDYLQKAFEDRKFLSELDISWAKEIQSRPYTIGDYRRFPQGEIM